MYSWSKDFPTLTELFFGKGNGPTGKTEPIPNVMTEKKPEMTVSEQMQEELEPIPSKK